MFLWGPKIYLKKFVYIHKNSSLYSENLLKNFENLQYKIVKMSKKRTIKSSQIKILYICT